MPDIYGSDFSSLQSGITADAALRQRGLEFALSSAVGSMQQMQQRQQLADQFAKTMAERGKQLDAEKEHWKEQATNVASELKIRKDAEARQSKYYDWLMGQPSQTKLRDRELDEKFLIDLSKQGQIDSDEEAAQLAPNASPAVRNIAVKQAKLVQSEQEKDFGRSMALANALTTKADRESRIAAATKENAKLNEPWIMGPEARVKKKQNEQSIAQWTAELEDINRSIKPFQDNKVLERYVTPSLDKPGVFEPAVPVPYHIQKRKQRDLESSMQLSPEERDTIQPADNAPAPMMNTRQPATAPAAARTPAAAAPAASTATGTQPSGNLAQVRSKSGEVWNIPVEKVPDAIRRGFQLIMQGGASAGEVDANRARQGVPLGF